MNIRSDIPWRPLLIGAAEIIFPCFVISSVVAYICSARRQLKMFIAMTTGFWCAAALINAGVFYTVDREHILVSLIAVAPLIWLPCFLLSFCVSGKLTRRAIVPVAFAAAVVAFPVAIYSSLTASCQLLHTIDTCI